jgi:hypothetical protein
MAKVIGVNRIRGNHGQPVPGLDQAQDHRRVPGGHLTQPLVVSVDNGVEPLSYGLCCE